MPITIRLADKNLAEHTVIKPVGQPISKLEANQLAKGSFFIAMPAEVVKTNNTKIIVEFWSGDKKLDVVKTNFMAPVNKTQAL
jgi:hypothetical protein